MARLTRKAWQISIALVGSALVTVAATAQSVGAAFAIRARSHWMVDARIPMRAPAKVTAKDNYRAPLAMLYPTHAYAIDAPVAISGIGINTADARTLIGLDADKTIGCFQQSGRKNVGQLLTGTFPLARLCLLDLDGDSAFDHYSVVQSQAEDVIQFEGVLSDIRLLDQPVAYRSVDPQSLENMVWLELPPPHYASWVKEVGFYFQVKDEKGRYERANADPRVGSFSATLPFSIGTVKVLFLGTPYAISREEKGDFLVAVTGESKPATVFLGTDCCWQHPKLERP